MDDGICMGIHDPILIPEVHKVGCQVVNSPIAINAATSLTGLQGESPQMSSCESMAHEGLAKGQCPISYCNLLLMKVLDKTEKTL